MTYALSLLADNPDCIYMLDDTPPFKDSSQNGRVGSVIGTAPKEHVSLVRGGRYSKVFGSGSVGSFESKAFSNDDQSRSFTLEAWVRVASIDKSAQQILGNGGNFDGLLINGTEVSFLTKYEDSTTASVSYDIQTNSRIHVVGVHTETKNSLYINGQLVAESNINAIQKEMRLAGISSNLFCGQGAGSQKIAVAGIASYSHALSPDTIAQHFSAGHNVLTAEEVTFMHNGITAPTTLDRAAVFIEQYWNSEEHWYGGNLENVSVFSGQLLPDFENDLSLSGRWTDTFIISQAEEETIHGVVVSWEGRGVLMEYTINNEDWYTLERNMPVEMITPGIDIDDKMLTIRATFTEGLYEDEQYLDLIRLSAIYSSESLNEYGLKIMYNNSYPRDLEIPASLSDSWGLVSTDTSATVQVDDAHAESLRTLEMWVRRLDDTAVSWTGTRFINGKQTTTVPPPGEWFLLTLIPTTPLTDSLSLGKNIQVGSIAAYEKALNAQEATSIYEVYSGTNILAISENTELAITESAPGAGIYGTDWALQSG